MRWYDENGKEIDDNREARNYTAILMEGIYIFIGRLVMEGNLPINPIDS